MGLFYGKRKRNVPSMSPRGLQTTLYVAAACRSSGAVVAYLLHFKWYKCFQCLIVADAKNVMILRTWIGMPFKGRGDFLLSLFEGWFSWFWLFREGPVHFLLLEFHCQQSPTRPHSLEWISMQNICYLHNTKVRPYPPRGGWLEAMPPF